MKTILRTVLLLISLQCAAQHKPLPAKINIDSVLALVEKDKEDTNKVYHLNTLCLAYRRIGDFEKALNFGMQGLALAKELGYDLGMANGSTSIGLVYWSQGNYDKALLNYLDALAVGSRMKNRHSMAVSYGNIGLTYDDLGNFDEALRNCFHSLDLMEELLEEAKKKNNEVQIKQYTNYVANTLNNIGRIYSGHGDYDKALEHYEATLPYRAGDERGLAASYNNIGVMYEKKGMYDKALENFNRALVIFQKANDRSGISAAYFNIGDVNLARGRKQLAAGDKSGASDLFAQALRDHQAALELREAIGDQKGLVQSYLNIAGIYRSGAELGKALMYLEKGFPLASKIRSLPLIRDYHQQLAEVHAGQNNYKAAYDNQQLFLRFKDSISNEDKSREIGKLEARHEFDKEQAVTDAKYKADLEKQQALADAESRRQKLVIYSVSTGLLLVLALALVIFRSLRQNKEKNRIITEQKRHVEAKQKEIVDSIHYARRIQKALLTPENYIRKELDRLGGKPK